MINFAKEIKAIRKVLGMNQAEFAEAVSASQGSVSKWERGLENPRTETWFRIRSLYESHEGHRTAGVFHGFSGPAPTQTILSPLIGMLDFDQENDVVGGKWSSVMNLALPQLPDIEGLSFCWVVPLHFSPYDEDIRSGTVIFSLSPPNFEPQDGDRVIVQNRGAEAGSFNYSLRYHGMSKARGVEWFTWKPTSADKVALASTIPIGKRADSGISVVGYHFASLTYASPLMNLLEAQTDDRIF